MKNPADRVREELATMTSRAMTKALCFLMNGTSPREAVPAAVHLGCNVALNALIPIAPFVAKRPVFTPEEARQKGPDELVKLMSYERILFAALIVARMQGDLSISRRHIEDEEGNEVVEFDQVVNFGPFIMGLALEDWKKVTGKEPTEYLDNNLLEAIAKDNREFSEPFAEFLKGRKAAPSSGTLQ